MGREDLVSRIKDYCDTMGSTAAHDVEVACNRLGKVNSAFIPSAGQVYSAAQEEAARRTARLVELTPRLPRYEMPEAQREAMKLSFQELVDELESGKNLNQDYRLIQRGEKPRDPYTFTRDRITPSSWLDKWERENSRPYYGLKEAAE